MFRSFQNFIASEKLFTSKDKILLAVSGGIDSSVMCHLFYEAGYKFAIAHCNFGLRKEESAKDEAFVKKIAKKYKVPYYSKRFDTNSYAIANKLSVQMAARDLRYEWFEDIRKEDGYDYVAVAHHLDDETETFFINLIRGTGISGLHGILPKKDRIIRPLLFANRKNIEKYAKREKISFREDSSNLSQKYTRNKIRQTIIPSLREMNPSIELTIKKDIERLKEVEQIFRQAIDEKRTALFTISPLTPGTETVAIKELQKLKPLSTWLYELLRPYQFNIETVNDIIVSLNKSSGKMFFSSTHRIIKDRANIIITSLFKNENEDIEIDSITASITAPLNLSITKTKKTTEWTVPRSKFIACLDYDKLTFPLKLRKWKAGDWFYPFGMNKKKKLSDFLIDRKISIDQKETIYVLESAGNIVWVAGERIDNRLKISENTKIIYIIKLEK